MTTLFSAALSLATARLWLTGLALFWMVPSVVEASVLSPGSLVEGRVKTKTLKRKTTLTTSPRKLAVPDAPVATPPPVREGAPGLWNPMASPFDKKAPPSEEKVPVEKVPTATEEPTLDFNLLEDTKAIPVVTGDEALKIEKASLRRRQMLTLHQGLGFAMLGSLALTEVVGQLNLDDKFLGGGDKGTWQALHVGLATGTLALFATVGMLGVFAPNPYPKKLTFDTATVHKTCMAIATVGMVTQIVLGIMSASAEGKVSQRNLATLHQVVGYTTLGATALGVTVLTF